MFRNRRKSNGPGNGPKERRTVRSLWNRIFVLIGIAAVLYLFITYVLIPFLAMLTVSS